MSLAILITIMFIITNINIILTGHVVKDMLRRK